MERLNKYLAHAGVGSRRHCDSLIAAGRVKINGVRVTDLGMKVDPDAQKVFVDDEPVRVEKPVYWVVHKPPGYLCTNHDPSGRPLAMHLIPHVEQRVYTVGRLDEASEGMLLMTNDGELAQTLMHPRYGVEKTYLVLVAGKPTKDDLQRLLDGVWLSDGKVRAKSVRRMKPQGDSTWIRVVLCEGKNREIRRMLAKLGHKVLRLKRVAIGPVLLDKLPKGKARKLSLPELTELKKSAVSAERRVEKVAGEARQNSDEAESQPATKPVPPRHPAPGAPAGRREFVPNPNSGGKPSSAGPRVYVPKPAAKKSPLARPGPGRPGPGRPAGSRPVGGRPPGKKPFGRPPGRGGPGK
ncbi:pseudouridine synthase [Fimbriiglobus ruber]|uniref:Ribosomal large subunit pseudouridine synthase B n=1 Tax=Fimbriiglobus ruber TaxID=1908690 RepID=A0A225D0S9_9BACT|nr:pseudouridine synthase [Fimbriiglobus ruber]OWK35112.1 Ribosomal large subunit pseudouridine synthase B [Fimbriiglobus ruber]